MPNTNETHLSISGEYENIIDDLTERAELILEEQPELEDIDAIFQAIDEGFFRTYDQAIVLAYAYTEGLAKWHGEVSWDEISELLVEDITERLNRQHTYLIYTKEGSQDYLVVGRNEKVEEVFELYQDDEAGKHLKGHHLDRYEKLN